MRDYQEIVDEIVARDGAVTFPSKSDYYSYFRYHKGNVIATGATRDEIDGKEGVVERHFREEDYRPIKNLWNAQQQAFKTQWEKELREEYQRFNDVTYLLLYNQAYDHRSEGLDEVARVMDDLADLADAILRANKGEE